MRFACCDAIWYFCSKHLFLVLKREKARPRTCLVALLYYGDIFSSVISSYVLLEHGLSMWGTPTDGIEASFGH